MTGRNYADRASLIQHSKPQEHKGGFTTEAQRGERSTEITPKSFDRAHAEVRSQMLVLALVVVLE
jgi:hypothetical protein